MIEYEKAIKIFEQQIEKGKNFYESVQYQWQDFCEIEELGREFSLAYNNWINTNKTYLKEIYGKEDDKHLEFAKIFDSAKGHDYYDDVVCIDLSVNFLRSCYETYCKLYKPEESNDTDSANNHISKRMSKKVFIVHGHDSAVRTEVENLITKLGYKPIVLSKQANRGKTILEKLVEEIEEVCFAIILYTACDLGRAKDSDKDEKRARQNVVFEHGYVCAKLGLSNVCALLEEGVQKPGDLDGLVYIPLDKNRAWKLLVAKEMKAAGLDIDANKLL